MGRTDRSLAAALFTPVQRRVLGLLFGQPERQFQSAEIIRLAGSGTGAVHRQLQRLAESGLVEVRREGSRKFYRANPEAPIYSELQGLVRKAIGSAESRSGAATSAPGSRRQPAGSHRLRVPRAQLTELCRRHRIRRLALFGSVLRDDFGPASDVDVLVEFAPGARVGLRFFELEAELSRLLGRKVDLNTPAFLSPRFRARVVAEAETLYEAA